MKFPAFIIGLLCGICVSFVIGFSGNFLHEERRAMGSMSFTLPEPE